MKNKLLISVVLAETFIFILLYFLLVIFYNEFEAFTLILTIIFYIITLIITVLIYQMNLKKRQK